MTAFHVRIPLRKPVRHASHTRTDTDNRAHPLRAGRPHRGLRRRRAARIRHRRKHRFRPGPAETQRPGRRSCEPAAISRRPSPSPSGCSWPTFRATTAAASGNAAHCAVELALLDAYGRRFGSRAVRRDAPAGARPARSRKPRVRYSGAITSSQGVEAAAGRVGHAAVRLPPAQGESRHRRPGRRGPAAVDPQARRGRHGPAHRRQRGVGRRRGRRAHPGAGAVRDHVRGAAVAARRRCGHGRGAEAGAMRR